MKESRSFLTKILLSVLLMSVENTSDDFDLTFEDRDKHDDDNDLI
ncbi:MAG: hypothetical protein ACLFVR_13200 [Thiohalospira sp.]